MSKKLIITIISTIAILLLSSCSKASEQTAVQAAEKSAQSNLNQILQVYKNPNCGCCKKWISHINQAGFKTETHDRSDISELKQDKGIAPRYRSCHTAISANGFVFEGHVPAKFIKQFLLEKPKGSFGLSVPAMPVGTPGMEMGDRFMPYQVLLLKKDGSSEVYAFVQSSKEQY
jgi:hypothetical protein